MTAQRIARLVIVSGLMVLPSAAWAQSEQNGAIAGVARDTTGAVLPGVTVEAASPALIEKVRTVVTDDQGLYRIVDLRPGVYTVTFTLPGFATFRREGLELATSFTATVNAELRVGALEESVTVTGASPVVDIQNVTTLKQFSRETLDSLPVGKNMTSYATLTIGAVLSNATTQDVGGTASEQSANFTVHGNRSGDMKGYNDGNQFNGMGGAPNFSFSVNRSAVEEITIISGGMSAESETSGVRVNIIPKEGGNTFSGSFATNYAPPDFQSNNLTDTLRARGLKSVNRVKKLHDIAGGGGGPIFKDKLWFYTAARRWGTKLYVAGNYWNKTQDTLFYTPDLSRQAYTDDHYRNASLRLTWQAATKHKISLNYDLADDSCNCFWAIQGGDIAPEATGGDRYNPDHFMSASWSNPITNRLLFEAGAAHMLWDLNAQPVEGVTRQDISILELSTGYRYHGRGHGVGVTTGYGNGLFAQTNQRFSVSYITGSHAFKTGLFALRGWRRNNIDVPQSWSFTFRNQVPQSVTLWGTPYNDGSNMWNLGFYTQDQWTIRKVTLNLGMRFDYINAWVPARHSEAGRFVPARDYSPVSNVPNWKDVSPRLGAAYDLFGNGKTAVKASVGRYVASEQLGLAAANNPAANVATSATRTWNDLNGNYVPDCDLTALAANLECGPLSPVSFGTPRITTRYADDVLLGYGHRGYNWQGSASIQHEVRPGMALNVGYFRTWYGNFLATDNQAFTAADFTPYCVTAPVDARLPGGGGNQICGLYDITPAKFGRVNNLVTQASNFGKQTEVFDGVDLTLSARFGQGGQFSGGLSTGRTVADNCFANNSPQLTAVGTANVQTIATTSTATRAVTPKTSAFCHVALPWSAGTQVKLNAIYPLPWDLQPSVTFQNLPGVPITANAVFTNSQIAPVLGRNLAAGANATVAVELMPLGTAFENRITQVDVRLARTVRVGLARIQGTFDIYNAFNANSVLATVARYGPTFLQPNSVLAGRLFKFGVLVNF